MAARCVMLLAALQSASASREPIDETCSSTEITRPDHGMAALQSRSMLKLATEVRAAATLASSISTRATHAAEDLLFRELLSDRSVSQETRAALSSASRLEACAQRDVRRQDEEAAGLSNGETAESPAMTPEVVKKSKDALQDVKDIEDLKSDDCETKTKEVKKETEKIITSIKKIKGEITTTQMEVTTVKEELTTKLKQIKVFEKHVKREETKCEDKVKEVEKEITKVEKELEVIGEICYRKEVNLDISKTSLLQQASLEAPEDDGGGNLSQVTTSIMATKQAVADLAQCHTAKTRETTFLQATAEKAPVENTVEDEASEAAGSEFEDDEQNAGQALAEWSAAQAAAANATNMSLLQKFSTMADAINGCPPGGVTVGAKCFFVHNETLTLSMSYVQAIAACAAAGGHIASIHQNDENEAALGLLAGRSAYLGATRNCESATNCQPWQWEDGTPWVTPTWATDGLNSNQGKYEGGETHIIINTDRKWHDWAQGEAMHNVLCQVVQEGPACLPNAVDFDFHVATVSSNNLGGQGPAKGPEEIRFGSIGTLNANSVDMVVTVTNTDYEPNNNTRNGLNGAFGQINVMGGSRAELTFEFQDTATKAPVTLPEFYFSFFDIDHGRKGNGKETLILPNVEKFYFTKLREFDKIFNKGTLTLESTHVGHACDNPTDPMNLGNITCEENTVVRSRRSVTLEYTHRTRFTAIFSAGLGGGGRNILFAGRSSLVKNCVNKARIPKGPATEKHCLEEEKEFEKKCEDLTKEITRTKVIKEKQNTTVPCKKIVETEWESMKLVQLEVEELTKTLNKKVKIIEELKPGLEIIEKTKKKFIHVYNETVEECKPITPEIEELEEVITSMEGCPGLEENVYGPPEWAGGFARVDPKPGMTTDAIDALLTQACKNKFGTNTARKVRAAEVSEILAGTIKNLPSKNDGTLPILPTCPLCLSKHDDGARICWRENDALTAAGESGNCRKGPRNALCVYAR